MHYLVGVLALPAAMAWWDGGHYISGAIARQTLIDQGREDAVEWIEKILALDPESYGKHSSFLTAPTWMDDIRSTWSASSNPTTPRESVRTWDSNHFMNIPIENDCKGECATLDAMEEYLGQGINHIDVLLSGALAHMAPEGSNRIGQNGMLWATQLHLRWLFHLMGDAHMPFHMTGLWHRGLWECPAVCEWSFCTQCREYPDHEDAEEGKTYLLRNHHCNGGNFIYITLDEDNWPTGMELVATNNLHGFWDSMGGFAQGYANTVSEEEKLRLAQVVMDTHPFAEMREKFNIWGNNWTLKKDVYPYVFTIAAMGAEEDIDQDNKRWYGFMNVDAKEHMCLTSMNWDTNYCSSHRSHVITEEYRAFTERASKRLVALAGYRLADALSRVVDGLPERLRTEIDQRLEAQEDTCEECETCNNSGANSLMTLGAGILATGALMVVN